MNTSNVKFTNIPYEMFQTLVNDNMLITSRIEPMLNHFKDVILIKHGITYVFMRDNFYKSTHVKVEKLLFSFMNTSFNNLSETNRSSLTLNHRKSLNNLMKYGNFEKLFIGHTSLYENDDITLDNDNLGLHFINGRLNLSNGQFEERKPEHKITEKTILNYNYTKSTSNMRNYIIKDVLDKIFLKPEIRNYFLDIITSSIIGKSYVCKQYVYFFTGEGSNGKSLLMELLSNVFLNQYMEVSSKITTDNKDSNQFSKAIGAIQPYHRVLTVNEAGTTMNKEQFKLLAEKSFTATFMYQQRQDKGEVLLNSYLFIITNDMPRVKVDNAIERRLRVLPFESNFVDANDPKKMKLINNVNVFKRDETLTYKFISPEFKCAFVDILLKHCMEFIKTKDFKTPSYILEKSKEVITMNDYIQNFTESQLTITNNEHDIIGKEKMRDLYTNYYPPSKNIKDSDLINELKRFNIKYNKDKYNTREANEEGYTRKRGVFVGVKQSNDIQEEEGEEEPTKENEIIKAQSDRIQALEAELKALQAKLSKLTAPDIPDIEPVVLTQTKKNTEYEQIIEEHNNLTKQKQSKTTKDTIGKQNRNKTTKRTKSTKKIVEEPKQEVSSMDEIIDLLTI